MVATRTVGGGEPTASEHLESEHLIDGVVLDHGRVAEEAGDPAFPRFLRSSLKPCQAMLALERGVDLDLGLEPRHLAVMAASHSGQDLHLRCVREAFARAGLDESLLACGPHAPLHGPSARAMWLAGEEPRAIHNNCSGKHMGMLLACHHAGWPTAGYRAADHPAQKRIRELLVLLGGEEPAATAVDGCGVPTWAVSLHAAARMIGRVARPTDLGPAGWGPALEGAATRLVDAIHREPVAFAGEGRSATRLLSALGAHLLCKGGAEGVWVMASTTRDWSCALKVRDGNARALNPVVLDILRRHGILDGADLDAEARADLAALASPILRNHEGTVVGGMHLG